MKPTVVTFSTKLDAEFYFANCVYRDPNFKVCELGKCSVDKLHYYVVHSMKKNKPSKLIAATYRGIVSRERRQHIYLGD